MVRRFCCLGLGSSWHYGALWPRDQADASSFQTWGMSSGNWHPLGSGYVPQPGDVAEYSGAHVAIYVSGPANSPTVVNGDWWYPDTRNGQVFQQASEKTAGGGAISGYVSPPSGSGSATGNSGSSTSSIVFAPFNNGGSYGDLVNIVGSTVQTWIGQGNGLYNVVTQNTGAPTSGTWLAMPQGNGGSYGDLVNIVGSTVQTWIGQGNGLYNVVTQNTGAPTSGTWLD